MLTALALSQVPGLGPVLTKRILDHFAENPERLWETSREELATIEGLRPSVIDAILGLDGNQAQKEYDKNEKAGITLTAYGLSPYPTHLKNIYDPPTLLYQKGSFQTEDNLALAIVGTRYASNYALRNAYEFARQIAQCGITVVSGLAKGVDIAAHRGAIAAGGRTIAVLGSGLDCVYPPQHAPDAARIATQGVLASEYPLGTQPLAYHFPQRNRIISGLSLGVIVIEAGLQSGALITAHVAIEQGREVFALPGEINREQTQGTHQLIQEGAKLVTCLDDVLAEILPLQHKRQPRDPSPLENEGVMRLQFDEDEQKIWDVLPMYPVPIDLITNEAGLNPSLVATKLLVMEMNGVVELFPGQRYARKS